MGNQRGSRWKNRPPAIRFLGRPLPSYRCALDSSHLLLFISLPLDVIIGAICTRFTLNVVLRGSSR
jgi:hypothetical protein